MKFVTPLALDKEPRGILGLSNNLAKSIATEFDPGLLLRRTSGKCCSTAYVNDTVCSSSSAMTLSSISKFVAVRVSGGIGSSLGRVFFFFRLLFFALLVAQALFIGKLKAGPGFK